MLFEELGFRYFGPIDGHNIAQLVQAFEIVKTLRGPRVVHVITEKGKGFPLPEPDLEKYHARAPYDPVTGQLKPVNPGLPQWTKVFGEAITQLAAEYPSLVAITAAMPSGTGTNIFQRKWPERFFDAGIAEAHATTFAAGLATPGVRPGVAIYSTFLQRAYDSIMHAEAPPAAEVAPVPYGSWEVLRRGRDCALLAVGVMCRPALDAAAALAADGWDVTVVNCRFLKPIDGVTLEALTREHRLLVTIEDGTVVNGFGASLTGIVQASAPEVRVVALGVPDRTFEHAPRAQQLDEVGLTGPGIAARVRALATEESLTHS